MNDLLCFATLQMHRPKRTRADSFIDSSNDDQDYEDGPYTEDDESESTESSLPVIRAGNRCDASDFLEQQARRPIKYLEGFPNPTTRFDFDDRPEIEPIYAHHLDPERPLFFDHFRFVSKYRCPIYGHVAPYVYVVWSNGHSNLIHPNAFHDGEPYAYLRVFFLAWLRNEMTRDTCDTLIEAWAIATGPRRNVLAELYVDDSENRALFCSLCGFMHSSDSFSAEQRKAPPQKRSCIEHTYAGDPMRLDSEGDPTCTPGFKRWWKKGIVEREIDGDSDEIVDEAAKIKNDRDVRRAKAIALRQERIDG